MSESRFAVVGAPEYGNERICYSIKTEHMDSVEIGEDNFEPV